MKRTTATTTLALLGALALPAGTAVARGADRDHDGMRDRWEHRHHVRAASGNPDHDALANRVEYRLHLDPRDADTDDDGVRDGAEDSDRDGVDNADEVREHTDPADREDVEVSGTVVSFSGGVLTLRLADGSERSGSVTSGTEVECEGDESAGDARAASRGDDDGSERRGDDEQGDDDDRARDDDGEQRAQCSTELTAGRRVLEAELAGRDGGVVFTEIKLAA